MATTKFTDEEIKAIGDIQNNYNQKMDEFGKIKVQRILIDQQIAQLNESELKLEKE